MFRDALPLTQLDPREAWSAWEPTAEQPWNRKWAGQLFRRAAFGCPPRRGQESAAETLDRAVRQGLESCFEQLFAEPAKDDKFESLMDDLAPTTDPRNGGFNITVGSAPHRSLQAWWMHRLWHSPFHLRERLTLFWHSHFATSLAKVRQVGLLLQQNRLFRERGAGRFGELLLAVSRDPAMVLWLDSASNLKEHPNENYARELLELFTLGVGHFNESDIRETARAFTGWGLNRSVNASFESNAEVAFQFHGEQHDFGAKTVFGQSGKWDGGDIVRIVLQQPAAAQRIATKLYRAFVSENEAPPPELLEPLARQLRETEYEIKPVLRTILRSRLFFSRQAYRQRIKSPVEFALNLAHAIGHNANPAMLAQAAAELGQELFAPPNVKGWDGGKAWLNSATLLGRHNLAWAWLSGEPAPGPATDANGQPLAVMKLDVRRVVSTAAALPQSEQLDFWLTALLDGELAPASRDKLAEWFAGHAARGSSPQRATVDLAHTIAALPEYQLA